jgi:hypothetical protein
LTDIISTLLTFDTSVFNIVYFWLNILEEMAKKKTLEDGGLKTRTELKSIASDVMYGKIRHVPKSDRKASLRDSELKESLRRQRKEDRASAGRSRDGGGRMNGGRGGQSGRRGRGNSSSLEGDSSSVMSVEGTRKRRGSLMDHLNHQRTMSQHHALKEIVMDLSKAHAARNRRNSNKSWHVGASSGVLGKIGLTIPKAPATPRGGGGGESDGENRRGSRRGSKVGSRRGTTPRTKFMRETQVKSAYGGE